MDNNLIDASEGLEAKKLKAISTDLFLILLNETKKLRAHYVEIGYESNIALDMAAKEVSRLLAIAKAMVR